MLREECVRVLCEDCRFYYNETYAGKKTRFAFAPGIIKALNVTVGFEGIKAQTCTSGCASRDEVADID